MTTLNAILRFALEIVPSTSIEAMSVRFETLNETWQEFKDIRDRFQLNLKGQLSLFSRVEENYHRTKAILLEQIKIREKIALADFAAGPKTT